MSGFASPALSRSQVVLGFTEGILTALVLAAGAISGRIQAAHEALLAVRVGAFAFGSGFFVYFLTSFFERRQQVLEVGRQLSVPNRRQLLATRLGRQATVESVVSALTASGSSFVGGALPLAIAAALPGVGAAGLVAALLILALMGVLLARITLGKPVAWAAAMVGGGGALAAIGSQLRLISG